MDEKKEPDLLHVYAQAFWHTESIIVGNRAALIAAKEAIERALTAPNHIAQAPVMGADGEGYDLYVIMLDEPWLGERWSRLAVPYTDDEAKEKNDKAIWPASLLMALRDGSK